MTKLKTKVSRRFILCKVMDLLYYYGILIFSIDKNHETIKNTLKSSSKSIIKSTVKIRGSINPFFYNWDFRDKQYKLYLQMNKNNDNKYVTTNKKSNVSFSLYIYNFSRINLRKSWLSWIYVSCKCHCFYITLIVIRKIYRKNRY